MNLKKLKTRINAVTTEYKWCEKIRGQSWNVTAKPQQGDINIQTYDILMEWTGGDNLGRTILLFITGPPCVRHMNIQASAMTSRCVCVCACVFKLPLLWCVSERNDGWMSTAGLPLCLLHIYMCVYVCVGVTDRCECRGLSVLAQTPLNTCSQGWCVGPCVLRLLQHTHRDHPQVSLLCWILHSKPFFLYRVWTSTLAPKWFILFIDL